MDENLTRRSPLRSWRVPGRPWERNERQHTLIRCFRLQALNERLTGCQWNKGTTVVHQLSMYITMSPLTGGPSGPGGPGSPGSPSAPWEIDTARKSEASPTPTVYNWMSNRPMTRQCGPILLGYDKCRIQCLLTDSSVWISQTLKVMSDTNLSTVDNHNPV